ncbi:MAG: hypothetical protein JXC32_20270 [Anaerolineae bacterium]|nr:hypothetical protein [Anaerolineae bacterium]
MDSPRTRALLIGGALGALIGAIAGWIYYNSNVQVDNEGAEALDAPTPGTAVKLGLGLLGVLRLIAD